MDDAARLRVHRLATGLVLDDRGPVVDDAIGLAVDLLAAGHETPAVLEVAVLAPGTARSEAEPAVRRMLRECGVRPPPTDPAGVTDYLVDALVAGALPASDLVLHLHHGLAGPPTPLERELAETARHWEVAAEFAPQRDLAQVLGDDPPAR